MRVVDKRFMPACCVAANCNNSQTTPGITMHELPRNWPTVRRKWIKFIQLKRADFLAAPHRAHLCSEHFSECDFANPMDYRMAFASKLTRSFKILPNRLKLYPCGSFGKSINFVIGARVGHFECEIPRELFYAKGQRSGSDVTNRQATKRGSRVCVSVHWATDMEKCPVQIL